MLLLFCRIYIGHKQYKFKVTRPFDINSSISKNEGHMHFASISDAQNWAMENITVNYIRESNAI